MNQTEYERATRALRDLENLGMSPENVKALWRDLTAKQNAHELGEPSEWDRMYTLPTTPPLTEPHLAGGGGDKLPQVLAPHVMWAGHHYSLSPGQREWFRDNTALTPSRTVTIAWVEAWKGTQHPRSFKVVSDVHIDPSKRRHVLNEYVVRDAGRFFHEAQENDAREKVEKTLQLILGPVNVWSSKHRWAVEDLSNVKLRGDKISIVLLSDTMIGFADESGKQANVSRVEFLETIADYERLYKDKRHSSGNGGGGKKSTQEFIKTSEKMMEDLERQFGE
jgi:hypothetical protein